LGFRLFGILAFIPDAFGTRLDSFTPFRLPLLSTFWRDSIQSEFVVKEILEERTVSPMIVRAFFAHVGKKFVDNKSDKGKGAYRH
jgi:hypothetical protein